MSYMVGPSLKLTSHSEKEIEQIDQMIGGLFATMYKNYYLPISLFVCGSFQLAMFLFVRVIIFKSSSFSKNSFAFLAR